MLTGLMLLVSVSAWTQAEYSISTRGTVENGDIEISPKTAQAGTAVTIYCKPHQGYGISRGLSYAFRNSNGEFSAPQTANCTSTYPDDRANTQDYTFTMPAGDVEVWATFAPLRTMVIHQTAGGWLKPQYGRGRETDADTNVVSNIPLMPVRLVVNPRKGYELVDVNITNVSPSFCEKSSDLITVYMPSKNDTVHVTPVFGKSSYAVTIDELPADTANIRVRLSNAAPKSREEVDVVLTCRKGFIPRDFTITGCRQWWRVGKPRRDSGGGWTIVYRFRVDLDDVTIRFASETVHTFTVNDTRKSGRVVTSVPEVIPDFPGLARPGQLIPVVFQMPSNYSVTYAASLTPTVYHNALKNSFADQGMAYWRETADYVNAGLSILVDADDGGNNRWNTSVRNSMTQEVSLAGRIPAAAKADGKLGVAVLAAINPRLARCARVSVVAVGQSSASERVVADLSGQPDGWQHVFRTVSVDAGAGSLRLKVSAEADNPNGRYRYDGPQFDDLCLLLPTDGKTISDADVLVFTMGTSDVTIDYTPAARQSQVAAVSQEHGRLTLLNATTREQGDTVRAARGDTVVVRGTYDDGYAIYGLLLTHDGGTRRMELDSVSTATRQVYSHYVKRDDKDVTVAPLVDRQQVFVDNGFGGVLTVDNPLARAGQKVVVTVTLAPGSRLKLPIRTFPAGVATITPDSVDATSGGGTYSFVMPSSYLTLIPEYVASITRASQLDSISWKRGEFCLDADLDLGNHWSGNVTIAGQFNGSGHRITYGGTSSLFHTVSRSGSVSHLYVDANVEGEHSYIGGIAMYNEGAIEDCAVTGTLRNEDLSGAVGGAVGRNSGSVSHCHVACESIDGQTACGIACQEEGATLRDCVFGGRFAANDGQAFMVGNDVGGSTTADNYYTANDGNSGAVVVGGVTASEPERLVDMASGLAGSYPVFAASIRSSYNAYTVGWSAPCQVSNVSIAPRTAPQGAIVRGSLTVDDTCHLDGIVVSAPDGSDARCCPFDDDTENGYSFSFTMPGHDVLVTFTTKTGTLVHNARQFADISGKSGKFILASDIELNNWNTKVSLNGSFHGGGHTIRYDAVGSCQGLFYKVMNNALLEGLRVVGKVESNDDCGGIAYRNNGTIRDCHFTGSITKVPSPRLSENLVAAIAYKVGRKGLIDHCSATGVLTSRDCQAAVDEHPLCAQTDANIKNSVWISSASGDSYQELLAQAEAARQDYPVYAQGIVDQLSVTIVTGSDTVRVPRGERLAELTITDGEPFSCTADVQVLRVNYERRAMTACEPWVLPFAFDQIAGDGTFEYHRIVENNNMPDIGPANTLTLAGTPVTVSYAANEPWMVRSDGGGTKTFVLTSSNGAITLKATYSDCIRQYSSVRDIGIVYATYDGIPAAKAREPLAYTWDKSVQAFCLAADGTDIQPFRYYLQFYNKDSQKPVTYDDTWWAGSENATDGRQSTTAPRRLPSAVADGWQPVFLDPRQPQSVTARMLDNYEVACLTDIRSEAFGEDTDSPLSAVSLVYQLVDSRMDLPSALPLLVRAKRSDAEPLADARTGAELDSLLTLSLVQMLLDDDDDDDNDYLQPFDMTHYWCASFGNRLDVWPLPASERYTDLAEFGCMTFDDNYFDQSFSYATATDSRRTAPMSYCITVLNTDTYELLPLMGNRVRVEFIGATETTGIETVDNSQFKVQSCYNLNGQRVGPSYKGIVVTNGRKVFSR
jgi:hypothetical protein